MQRKFTSWNRADLKLFSSNNKKNNIKKTKLFLLSRWMSTVLIKILFWQISFFTSPAELYWLLAFILLLTLPMCVDMFPCSANCIHRLLLACFYAGYRNTRGISIEQSVYWYFLISRALIQNIANFTNCKPGTNTYES